MHYVPEGHAPADALIYLLTTYKYLDSLFYTVMIVFGLKSSKPDENGIDRTRFPRVAKLLESSSIRNNLFKEISEYNRIDDLVDVAIQAHDQGITDAVLYQRAADACITKGQIHCAREIVKIASDAGAKITVTDEQLKPALTDLLNDKDWDGAKWFIETVAKHGVKDTELYVAYVDACIEKRGLYSTLDAIATASGAGVDIILTKEQWKNILQVEIEQNGISYTESVINAASKKGVKLEITEEQWRSILDSSIEHAFVPTLKEAIKSAKDAGMDLNITERQWGRAIDTCVSSRGFSDVVELVDLAADVSGGKINLTLKQWTTALKHSISSEREDRDGPFYIIQTAVEKGVTDDKFFAIALEFFSKEQKTDAVAFIVQYASNLSSKTTATA